MFNKKLIPSLLAFPKQEWNEEIPLILENKIKISHFDVMDQDYVSNTAFEADDLIFLEKFNLKQRVHLMVRNPYERSQLFLKKNVHSITFQYEPIQEKEIIRTLAMIKKNGFLAGIAICPNSRFFDYEKYLNYCDIVTVMGVMPGFGGQMIMNEGIENLNFILDFKKQNNLTYFVEFDGGVNEKTIHMVNNKADFIVSGTYIYGCLIKKKKKAFSSL